MANIQELKNRIDLHDLAEKLGLERPKGNGNYRSPHHKDKNPSLSIFNDGKTFKDFSSDAAGSCIDLIMYVEDLIDESEAVRRLHELYNIPFDNTTEAKQLSQIEWIAARCLEKPELGFDYLKGRKIDEKVIQFAVKRRTLGYSDYHSPTVEPGKLGYCGPAVAFISRNADTSHVEGVDYRFLDPELNGGLKTKSQGEKNGSLYIPCTSSLKKAKKVYIVESPINALTVLTAFSSNPFVHAVAMKGTQNQGIDWRFLRGKEVIICPDHDDINDKGYRPGQSCAWRVHEELTAVNIPCLIVDTREWEVGQDINDLLVEKGADETRMALERREPWLIPGQLGDDTPGKPRIYLPFHDAQKYPFFEVRPDFTQFFQLKRRDDEEGSDYKAYEDVCGFRVAAVSKVTIASAKAVMSGEDDDEPHSVFAAAVQVPRHGNVLIRRVLHDENLHNIDQWRKFGPIYRPAHFARVVNIWERAVSIGGRTAINFVGLAWKERKLTVNEGVDCFFTDPQKQCPYHGLTFPRGQTSDARSVVEAYQETFKENAATQMLVWALGCHLKALIGFWPHLVLQADKGAGKSTIIKRLERTIGFTMFSGQSLQTEFRLLTSVSHTSHPVGWEEISARNSQVIDKAVALLQESYQYTITRRGSDMTEYLVSAPVLLAGEDVPVNSLLGKVTRVELTGKKGPMMPETLPKFPVKQWLDYLSGLDRETVAKLYAKCRKFMSDKSSAAKNDDGAMRMVGNYAAVLAAWRLVCRFANIDEATGAFIPHLITEMNSHIVETSSDREPWVWIMEVVLGEIDSNQFRYPYQFSEAEKDDNTMCLFVRPSHVMQHFSQTPALRDKYNALPVKSAKVLKKQLERAGVLHIDDKERTINGKRVAHLSGLSLEKLQEYGLSASIPTLNPNLAAQGVL